MWTLINICFINIFTQWNTVTDVFCSQTFNAYCTLNNPVETFSFRISFVKIKYEPVIWHFLLQFRGLCQSSDRLCELRTGCVRRIEVSSCQFDWGVEWHYVTCRLVPFSSVLFLLLTIYSSRVLRYTLLQISNSEQSYTAHSGMQTRLLKRLVFTFICTSSSVFFCLCALKI